MVSLLACAGFCADEDSKTKEEKQKQMSIEEFVNQFEKGLSENKKLFDEFFSDNYFSGDADSFKGIDNVKSMMKEMIKNYNLNFFENSFNNWYKARLGAGDFNVSVENKKDAVIMKITIQGLSTNNLDVNINSNRIKIVGGYTKTNEVKVEKNKIISENREYQTFEKIMSLPENVAAEKAQVKTEKDEIIITFPKKNK